MDLICRTVSLAVRTNGDEGIEKHWIRLQKGLRKMVTQIGSIFQ